LEAQSDYGLTLRIEQGLTRVARHAQVVYSAELTKPVNAQSVVVQLDIPGDDLTYGFNCTGPKPVICTIPPEQNFVTVGATLNTPGTWTATARVVGTSAQSSWTVEVVDAPSLSVWLGGAGRYEPARPGNVFANVANYGAPASDVTMTMTLPEGGTFAGAVASDDAVTCTVTPEKLVCTRASLANRAAFAIQATVAMPDRLDGGQVQFAVSVASGAPDFSPADDTASSAATLIRHLLVVNTNDEGAGSLRQALLDAPALCAEELCTIDFRIAGEGEGGRFVIRPRSELPEVQGIVKIDGATQTAFGGDTNPDGPEIVLDGSLIATPARGLVLGGPSCEMYVLDLAIVNFSAPGIQAHRGIYDYQRCEYHLFPNTVIARNHLSANDRGIALVAEGYATVADNVIDGNRRAGIFADRFSRADIVRNRVTRNGASGIFLNVANPWDLQAAVVEQNVISGNAQWGIARAFSGDVSIRRNAIFGNGALGIDIGLDLETPNAPSDPHFGPGVPNKPVLLSAVYDTAANKTRVRGRIDSDSLTSWTGFTLDFYASAAPGDAEQWLAALPLPHGGAHTDFEIEVDGDLRGRFITATNTRMHIMFWDDPVFDTSELSAAIRVE
ncbi:MAG TPA: right-handed parallel beta-helix repeat-containing protein, partial [Thermoanaerobaculia bacterium]|nr:right-handed parallel beta-helix repeat-containing protein [Thermoanaerobaculia bacterium]